MMKNRRNHVDGRRRGFAFDSPESPGKNEKVNKYTRTKKYVTEKNGCMDGYDDVGRQNQKVVVTTKRGKSIRSFVSFSAMASIIMSLFFKLYHQIEISHNPSYQINHKKVFFSHNNKNNNNDIERLFENAVGNTSEILYMGLYIENNTLYCYPPKMKQLDKLTERHQTFTDMVTQTLQQYPLNLTSSRYHQYGGGGGVPIFFIHTDMTGCESYKEHDLDILPHLAWSEPLYNESCLAISIPGYFNWREHVKTKIKSKHWTDTFQKRH